MAARLVSADSHMLVLDEHVLAHLPAKHHEGYLAAKGAHRRPGVTAASVADAPRRNDTDVPAAGRPGEFDPHQRLADMDIDGVDAEVLYTDNTAGAAFHPLEPELALAALRAFNSAAIDFASVNPNRLLPVYLLPVQDIEAAIKELQRIANEGARAVQLPLYPGNSRLPPYFDAVYEPLWSALEETRIPASLHVCPPAGRGLAKDPTPAQGIFKSLPPIMMAQPLVELVVSGVFTRHPDLRVVLVEAGLGWIPFMLDRLDRMYRKNHWPEQGMPLVERPSFYWHRNVSATFEEDELGLELRHHLGVDNLMWATDYPHPDSTWPESRAVVREQFAGCGDDEVRRMVCDNAVRLYGL